MLPGIRPMLTMPAHTPIGRHADALLTYTGLPELGRDVNKTFFTGPVDQDFRNFPRLRPVQDQDFLVKTKTMTLTFVRCQIIYPRHLQTMYLTEQSNVVKSDKIR